MNTSSYYIYVPIGLVQLKGRLLQDEHAENPTAVTSNAAECVQFLLLLVFAVTMLPIVMLTFHSIKVRLGWKSVAPYDLKI